MNLRKYLETYGICITRFAKKVDVSTTTIYNIMKGQKTIKKIANRIEIATEGKVLAKDIEVQSNCRDADLDISSINAKEIRKATLE